MLFIFQGAFTVGFQATVWVYPSEILPLRLRQRGSSISTGTNWIMNFLIVYITPPAIRNIKWRTYIIFAVLNATWVPIMVRSCYSNPRPYTLLTHVSSTSSFQKPRDSPSKMLTDCSPRRVLKRASMPLWMRRMFHTSPTGLRRSKDHCSAFDVLISKSNFWEEMYELRYSFTFFCVFQHEHHAFLVQPCDL